LKLLALFTKKLLRWFVNELLNSMVRKWIIEGQVESEIKNDTQKIHISRGENRT
jgi:hypothetical protein